MDTLHEDDDYIDNYGPLLRYVESSCTSKSTASSDLSKHRAISEDIFKIKSAIKNCTTNSESWTEQTRTMISDFCANAPSQIAESSAKLRSMLLDIVKIEVVDISKERCEELLRQIRQIEIDIDDNEMAIRQQKSSLYDKAADPKADADVARLANQEIK